jgi:phosphate:Na+ symporter
MALTLVMCNNGWIPFEMGAAMVLGENIGTTITANIAASVANVSARRAAMAHSVFNVFGVVWVLLLFHPFLHVVSKIITAIGLDNPLISGASSNSVLYGISMVHTLFNICNTMILVWFTNQIAALVTSIIKSKKDEGEVFRLKHISGGLLNTSELSLGQAKAEIIHFATLCKRQYGYAKEALNTTDPAKFDELYKKLEHYEQVTDRIEFEIAKYLNDISEGQLSEESGRRLQAMYKIISELESVGDSGFNVARILQRRNIHNKTFDEAMVKKLNYMTELLETGFDAMITNLTLGYDKITDISNAQNVEQDINEYRNNLREEHLLNLENNVYSYLTGVYYTDLIAEYEHVGDFLINISEAIIEIK